MHDFPNTPLNTIAVIRDLSNMHKQIRIDICGVAVDEDPKLFAEAYNTLMLLKQIIKVIKKNRRSFKTLNSRKAEANMFSDMLIDIDQDWTNLFNTLVYHRSSHFKLCCAVEQWLKLYNHKNRKCLSV